MSKTEGVPSTLVYKFVDDLMSSYSNQRSAFERRWYDNNFFDDGFHFRYLSRETGKIVDLSQGSSASPRRSIPKASRQIRGVASLLLSLDPQPVIYPEPVLRKQFLDENLYKEEVEKAKDIAKKVGHWVEEKFDDLDISNKLVHLIILAAKHGVSFMQIWHDSFSKEIKSKVYDAFDIYLMGSLDSIYESPSITKASPILIDKIRDNDEFDYEQRSKLSPDNKFASSEVKQAYMNTQFGSGKEKQKQATVILKETFIKEKITDENKDRVKTLGEKNMALEGKNKGDVVMRHIFSTSNGTLEDEYLGMSEYPFIDFRFEPGSIYQVPLIERFIPANKSLDVAMSRLEGYSNTMVTGIYQKRKGENYKISNIPGGQLIEYEATPLTQMGISPVPGFMFNYINELNKIIEEQGASTSTLGRLPSGVKSGVAIESIKNTEYANLKIPTDMFKLTVRNIAKRLIEVGSDFFFEPETVLFMDNGEPDYFDVIGEDAAIRREEVGLSNQNLTILKKDYRVRIEIESGLGFTVEGKKESMIQIVDYMTQLAERGIVTPEALKILTNKFLEIFQFGSTQEFMDALDEMPEEQVTDESLQKMKIALLETMKDAGVVGEQAEQRGVEQAKVGVAEALRDLGT